MGKRYQCQASTVNRKAHLTSSTSTEAKIRGKSEKKTQLLALGKDDPRGIILRGQDLSRIFHCHSSKSSDRSSKISPSLRPGILRLHKTDDEPKPHKHSQHKTEHKRHLGYFSRASVDLGTKKLMGFK